MNENQKTLLYEGQHVRLFRIRHWEFADRVKGIGAVVIVAITPEGNLLLTEQFRLPVNANVIELPAGIAGDIAGHEREELATAAHRELLEETGYEAKDMTFLTTGPPSAGLATEIVTFMLATNLRCVHPGGGDEHEKITVHQVPLKDVPAWLQQKAAQGLMIDPKVYAGLYFANQAPA
jgi:ADP-ribose pyrophosphatase